MADSDDFEYDPERALWKPGRRGFLSLLGCAVAAAFLPDVPRGIILDIEPIPAPIAAAGWGHGLKIGDTFTIHGVYAINPVSYTNATALQEFMVKGIRESVVDIEWIDGPTPISPSGSFARVGLD